MNDNFQVDYEPNKRELYINLPEEAWDKIDNIIFTSHLEELELIDNNMTLKELEDYVHNKLKNLNQI